MLPVCSLCVIAVAAGVASRPAGPAHQPPIIGGEPELGDPAVVWLITADGRCTGTLIAPSVVLTGAHCIDESAEAGVLAGTVLFGATEDEPRAIRSIVDLFVHPGFRGSALDGSDIGLIRLDGPAPDDVAPLALNPAPSDELTGQVARVVGFGVSDSAEQSGAGIKRSVELAILDVDDDYLYMGDASRNTCQGDSGGPVLIAGDWPGERIIGVTSFGESGCAGPSRKTRVNAHIALVREVVAAWDGPCAHDGLCVATGCGEFADPDCGPCGVDGVCSADCPQADLDCPVDVRSSSGCALARQGDDLATWLVGVVLILLLRRRRPQCPRNLGVGRVS